MMQHLSKHFILIFDFFKNHDGKEPTKKKKRKKVKACLLQAQQQISIYNFVILKIIFPSAFI